MLTFAPGCCCPDEKLACLGTGCDLPRKDLTLTVVAPSGPSGVNDTYMGSWTLAYKASGWATGGNGTNQLWYGVGSHVGGIGIGAPTVRSEAYLCWLGGSCNTLAIRAAFDGSTSNPYCYLTPFASTCSPLHLSYTNGSIFNGRVSYFCQNFPTIGNAFGESQARWYRFYVDG